MSLSPYNKKRDFEKTAEPEGKEKSTRGSLRFVVQKHDASSLHYDFRLEMDGVLKSWAVPKGPSLNPADKRLAMMVEDHPVAYRNFEGVIPAGAYGGGTVVVWDEGTYEGADAHGLPRKENEAALVEALKKGRISFTLHGKKLGGGFTLMQMRGKGERPWLLVKKRDVFSSEKDITQNDRSVKSGKTLTEVALEHGAARSHPEERKRKPAVKSKTAAAKKNGSAKPARRKAVGKTSGKQIDFSQEESGGLTLNRHSLPLTHLQKLYFPKDGYRKGDCVNYYLKMAPYILPYLLDRPQSLRRQPNGITDPGFFQKDVRGKVPEWIETAKEFSKSTNATLDYLVCSNEATLIYMANLGCIEINPWHARKGSLLLPDWCLIDLDPHTGNSFDDVMEVARVTKKLLDAVGADACVKTSGSSGLHIYIPLGAKYGFEQSRNLAEAIVTKVNTERPRLTSLERAPAKRKNKIYLDFLQNGETQTAVAPYSLRPKPGMPVSTPLRWSELKKGLTQNTWNANNVFDRVKTEGDLFKSVLGRGIDLDKVMKQLELI